MDTTKKGFLRIGVILIAGIVISFLIIVLKPSPEPEAHREPPPHIAEIVPVTLESRVITVTSQGTVTPKTQIDITSQVSGDVIAVGDHFAAGGFFSAGEVLVSIDPRDYEIALVRAEATLADAKNTLAQEQGQARQAKREWRELGNQAANDLFLRKPQLAAAESNTKAAEAGVRQARLNLERTKIALPFDGRVVSVNANLGQFINSGSTLGSVYASDIMEVRLPLTAADLKLLNMRAADKFHELRPLTVDLYMRAGESLLAWEGEVVRLEANVDVKSRLFYLVAELSNRVDSFTPDGKPEGRSPILPGSFVEALITSNPHEDVVALPRSALYQSSQVMALDDENRLQLQTVKILQFDSEEIIVQGLENGQRVLARPPSFMDLGAVYTPKFVDFESAEPSQNVDAQAESVPTSSLVSPDIASDAITRPGQEGRELENTELESAKSEIMVEDPDLSSELGMTPDILGPDNSLEPKNSLELNRSLELGPELIDSPAPDLNLAPPASPAYESDLDAGEE